MIRLLRFAFESLMVALAGVLVALMAAGALATALLGW
jgi:hypothetical protein